VNYRNHIALNLATAHPHYDKEGNTYNMGTAIIGLGGPKYVIFKVPAADSGIVFRVMCFVINIKTGKATSICYHADALVVFHHINAYEDDGHLVFDIIAYKDANLYDMFYLHNMTKETDNFIKANKDFSPPDSPKGTNLVTLTDTTAQAVMQEDGSIYYREGRHRQQDSHRMGTKKLLPFRASVCCISRSRVILSSIISSDPSISPFLLILNAKTFEEIARASIPVPVHMDLHGLFIPGMVK
ncbi:hypothetical protein GOODEAATRI_008421, partial [Goodea atripinnis]